MQACVYFLEGHFFPFFFYFSFFSLAMYLYVCASVCFHTKGVGDVTLHMWRLENNLQELVLSP